MRAAVLVLSWNAADALLACLTSLAAQQRPPELTLVVDNGSHDGAADQVAAAFPSATLIRNPRNLGFAGGMNTGIRALQALPEPPDAVVLLNQDTLLDPGWLAAILAPLEADPAVGAVGCKIRYPDGRLQHAGITLDERSIVRHLGWHEPDRGQYDVEQRCDYVTGAALALRMSALATVGLLDEGYTPAYFEDLDLCWRLRHGGYRVIYAPKATLAHQESLSLRDEVSRSAFYNRSRLRFVLKSYPLATLEGFLGKELAFLSQHIGIDEGRVLRWAYAETWLALEELLAARRAIEPALPASAAATMHALLVELHRGQAEIWRRKASERAEWMFR
jgi:GT2 family glycosyltransferase